MPRAGGGAFQQGTKSGESESGPDGVSVPATARGFRNKGEMWIEAKSSPWGSTNLQPLGNLSDIGQQVWEPSSRAFCLCCLLYNVGGLVGGLAGRVGPQTTWTHDGLSSFSPLCLLCCMLPTRECVRLGIRCSTGVCVPAFCTPSPVLPLAHNPPSRASKCFSSCVSLARYSAVFNSITLLIKQGSNGAGDVTQL